jgi:ribosome-binding ATPase
MNIALIGLQKSGKTTIFNALTGLNAQVSEYASSRVEPNRGIVDVPDERVDALSRMYEPKKTIRATVEFVDFAAPARADGEHGVFSGEALQLIKTSDVLAVVLRNFPDEALSSVYGEPDPPAELDHVMTELLLSDQITVERRLERIESDFKRGKKTPVLAAEQQLFSELLELLSDGHPLRERSFTEEQKKLLSSYQFLTAKQVFAVLNSGDEQYGESSAVIAALEQVCPVLECAGRFEMELSMLDDEEEKREFMADMHIETSATARLAQFAYRTLGYISFFTVGKDEVRAWSIHAGENAVEAAGAIHSDLARGFIRAEVFSCDDLLSCGSEKLVKQAGKFRLEGKTYIVSDGDILNIRFSV